jgi:hypothetical protein
MLIWWPIIEENMGPQRGRGGPGRSWLRDVGVAEGSALMESLVMNYIERCQGRKADIETDVTAYGFGSEGR